MLSFFRKKKVLTKATSCGKCISEVCVCRDCQGLKDSCFNFIGTPCTYINGYNCGGYVDGTSIK